MTDSKSFTAGFSVVNSDARTVIYRICLDRAGYTRTYETRPETFISSKINICCILTGRLSFQGFYAPAFQ